METLEDIFRFIDALPLEDREKTDVKFVLLAQKFDRIPTRHELLALQKDITIRVGVMIVAGVGILATLSKIL